MSPVEDGPSPAAAAPDLGSCCSVTEEDFYFSLTAWPLLQDMYRAP